MNFFAWIRDGVRQAVLLGVSDAVENIGTPAEGEDIRHRLLEVLRNGTPPSGNDPLPALAKRKKLGRTLDQIHASAAKTS